MKNIEENAVGGALVANDVVYSYECRQPFTDVWPEFTGRTKPDLNDDDIRNVREYHAAPAAGALVAKEDATTIRGPLTDRQRSDALALISNFRHLGREGDDRVIRAIAVMGYVNGVADMRDDAAPESAAAPADLSKLRESLKDVTDVLDIFGNLSDGQMCPDAWRAAKAEEKIKAARVLLATAQAETPQGETQQPSPTGEAEQGEKP